MLILRSVLILLAFSGLVYLSSFLITDEVSSPCAPSGFVGRCYHTSQEVCEVVWANSDKTCSQWIKKFTFEPGRLTSPIIQKCKQHDLDKSLRQSLKSSSECLEYRRDLEDWKRANP